MKNSLRTFVACLLLAPLVVGCAGGSKSLSDMGDVGSLLGLVGGQSELSTLLSLVNAAGVGDLLGGSDPVTLLAPSNAAFQKLGKGTLDSLMKPENKDQLTGILKNHIIKGSLSSDALLGNAVSAPSLTGKAFDVAKTAGGQLSIGGATVTKPNLEAKNGIVHVIDTVLVP